MRDITLEDTIFIAFTTRAFATGIPTVLAGTPVVSAYENASLTQITAGITLGVDHDSVVGLNMLTIVATAANGYELGKDYNLVVTTGTVGGVSVVGEVVGQFTIARSAAAVDLANGTDGLGAIKTDTAAILVDTGTTLDTKLNDMQGGTFSSATDSLEAIRDRGDAAWTTGAGGSDRLLMVDTTIATLASQTSFTLTAGSADDNAYVNCTIVIEDVSTATQKAIGLISAYTGASKTVTLKYDPGVFTMAVTDKVYILAENSLKTTDQNRQLDVTSTGTAGVDWGNVENKATANDLAGTDIQLCDTVTVNTDVRGTDSAALASVCTEARLAELDGANLPTDVAAVKSDTAAILLDTGTDGVLLAAAATSAQLVDDVWDEVLTGATHNVTDSAGKRLRQIDEGNQIRSGTAQSGTANTIQFDTGASATDGIYDGDRVIIVGGTGAQEHGLIVSYVGSTKTATMAKNWAITPDATSEFVIIPGSVDVATIQHTVQTAGDLAALITARATPAQVNAEVSDVLKTDTLPELAQAAPPATPTFAEAAMLHYMVIRNKFDITATFKEVHNDAGTVIAKKPLSDDTTTYSEAEMVTGP